MIVETLLSNVIIPLRTSDTGEEALSMMNDFYIRHLPIVNNQQLLGLISEDDILNHDVKEAVGSYSLSLRHPYVNLHDHIYEVMRVLAEFNLTVIPVVDDEDNYAGLITMEDLLRYFAQTGSFQEPGSIVVLEIPKRDYSLAEIARIVESENAIILSAFVTSSVDSAKADVTIKINRQSIQNILASFRRFEYQVKASFNETKFLDTLKERFDSLMSYLNV